MPHYIPHSVYNLDETVAVSDNPLFGYSMEECAYQLYYQRTIKFAKINSNSLALSIHKSTLNIDLIHKIRYFQFQ